MKQLRRFTISFSTLILTIFRLAAHGILSPVEDERLLLLKELDFGGSELTLDGRVSNSNEVAEQVFMDECEILDWDYRAPELKEGGYEEENDRRASSHKLVEMSNDKSTPLRIRDGDFGMLDCVQYYFE